MCGPDAASDIVDREPVRVVEASRPNVAAMPASQTPIWARFLAYLRLQRVRSSLAGFALASILLVAFGDIDLRISRLFFDGEFYLAHQAGIRLLHHSVRYFIIVSILSVLAIYLVNRLGGFRLLGIDGRKVSYLFLVLIVGAGLIVNAGLKDHFGRARPRDLEEFGGSERFTPAFLVTGDCDSNCSFSSGDSAGAFFSLAFVTAFGRKRAIAIAAVGFGVLVSASRVASGAHFFSDTLVSYFVMLIVADALHYLMFQPLPETATPRVPVRAGALVRAAGAPTVPP